VLGGAIEDDVDAPQILGLRIALGVKQDRGVKLPEPHPEERIAAVDLQRAIEGGEGAFRVAAGQLDLVNALVAVDILRVEGNRLVCIAQRLLRLLQVARIEKRQLQIGPDFLRVRLRRVLQNVDRARGNPPGG
jgi:hypothetical protein